MIEEEITNMKNEEIEESLLKLLFQRHYVVCWIEGVLAVTSYGSPDDSLEELVKTLTLINKKLQSVRETGNIVEKLKMELRERIKNHSSEHKEAEG